jgi:hypothetical protein
MGYRGMKVFIVCDHGDGNISRVFTTKELAEKWLKMGHDFGWLYYGDCHIYEEEVYDTTD